MSATACQLCGKALSRIRLLREGDFCCREHREEYRLRRGINRVLEASAVSQLERRKERPRLMNLFRPALAARAGAPRLWDDAPSLGRAAYDFFVPALSVSARLRPAGAGYLRRSEGRVAAMYTRRPDLRAVRIRGRVALPGWSPARRPIKGLAAFGALRWHPPLTSITRPRQGLDAGAPLCLRGSVLPRLPRLALFSSGTRIAAPASVAGGVLARFHEPAAARGRVVSQLHFPSGDLRNIIPALGRRPGAPACAPRGQMRALRPSAMAPFSGPRMTEQRFRGQSRPVQRHGIRPAALGGTVRQALRSDLAAAALVPAKRVRRAPPIVPADAPDCPLTILPFDAVPYGGQGVRAAGWIVVSSHAAGLAPARRSAAVAALCARQLRLPACAIGSSAHSARLDPAPSLSARISHRPGASARPRLAATVHGAARRPELPALATRACRASGPALAAQASRTALRPAAVPGTAREALAPFVFQFQRPSCRAARLSIQGSVGAVFSEGAGAMSVMEENFGSGLDNWLGGVQDWRLDVAGARVGSLALFAPSLAKRDYEVEFLAKIERGIGLVFRAADLNNYYLVRISRREQAGAGALELTRCAVVGGVPDTPVTVPLPVTVRSKASFRVLTSVSGADFTVAVEGQIVDGWSDRRLQAGGIGFHAEKEDGARLYWVKLGPSGRSQTGAPVIISLRQSRGLE